MTHTGNVLVAIKKAIDKEKEVLKELIATGGCNNFETYYRKVGQIEGLTAAQEVIRDIAAKVLRSEMSD